MRIRHRVAASVIAAMILAMTVLTGLAQTSDSGAVEVTILGGGPLVGQLAAPARDDPNGSGDGPTRLFVTVLDARGTGGGWTIALRTDGAATLSLWPGNITVLQHNPDLTGHRMPSPVPVTSADTRFWIAAPNFGDGRYLLPLTGTLSAGSATGVLTVTMSITGTAP